MNEKENKKLYKHPQPWQLKLSSKSSLSTDKSPPPFITGRWLPSWAVNQAVSNWWRWNRNWSA